MHFGGIYFAMVSTFLLRLFCTSSDENALLDKQQFVEVEYELISSIYNSAIAKKNKIKLLLDQTEIEMVRVKSKRRLLENKLSYLKHDYEEWERGMSDENKKIYKKRIEETETIYKEAGEEILKKYEEYQQAKKDLEDAHWEVEDLNEKYNEICQKYKSLY